MSIDTEMNEIILLLKKTEVADDAGNLVQSYAEKQVWCKVLSIGQNEFYQGGAKGYKPEIKFVIEDYLDYEGQEVISYKEFGQAEPKYYSVIRTYRAGKQLEITCKRGVDQ